jgi:hypothetical protein
VSVGARGATSNDASTLGNRAGVPTASHRSGRLMTPPWMIGLPILTATVLERRAPEPLGPTRYKKVIALGVSGGGALGEERTPLEEGLTHVPSGQLDRNEVVNDHPSQGRRLDPRRTGPNGSSVDRLLAWVKTARRVCAVCPAGPASRSFAIGRAGRTGSRLP